MVYKVVTGLIIIDDNIVRIQIGEIAVNQNKRQFVFNQKVDSLLGCLCRRDYNPVNLLGTEHLDQFELFLAVAFRTADNENIFITCSFGFDGLSHLCIKSIVYKWDD